MKLLDIPFQTTDWSSIPPTIHAGDVGQASWRTKMHGSLRLRMVEYSAGYIANHWCEKGHILFCLEGELHTELADGRAFDLRPGMTYEVADGMEPHRSSSPAGAKLFIVD
jgi:hypothetical protein